MTLSLGIAHLICEQLQIRDVFDPNGRIAPRIVAAWRQFQREITDEDLDTPPPEVRFCTRGENIMK